MVKKVRAKKELGQHFLCDENIAQSIVEALSHNCAPRVVEVGPGMGVLTKYLIERRDFDFSVIELDRQSVEYLNEHFAESLAGRVVYGDFLNMEFEESTAVIGNFPYNISTQIFFHILDHRDMVPEVVGMLQREVAQRLAAPVGSREGGVLSVFLQAFYSVEYLFEVGAEKFSPPPKVQSAVIRCRRNSTTDLGCDEVLFRRVVKGAFSQRRKMLKNALYGAFPELAQNRVEHRFFTRRAENLTLDEFIELTNFIAQYQ